MTWRATSLMLTLLGALSGCSPEIGDSCEVSADCAESGDRICDPTQPGGYCTIFNCEPGSCPEEAKCIAFGAVLSSAAGCQDPNGGSRFQRTFCMRSCKSDSDCRGAYMCADLDEPGNPWGAALAETKDISGKVCVAPVSGDPLPESTNTEVCTGTDASFDIPPLDAGSDASAGGNGSGGVGGMSGGGFGGFGGFGGSGAVSGGGGVAGGG